MGDLHVTTSWRFKRDLANFFCRLSPRPTRLTALELGTFHGYTTAVLAAIFGRVLAVDVKASYLEAAAEHCTSCGNVVYLAVDSHSDSWAVLTSNRVHVAMIDGDHRYEWVRSDAHKALGLLRPLEYIVFDDYGVEHGVRRVVEELLAERALRECQPIGLGTDGAPWLLKGWDWVNYSEGMLCSRGSVAASRASSASFVDASFMLYAVPTDPLMRAKAVLSFWADGVVWTSLWGYGRWVLLEQASSLGQRVGLVNLTLPRLGSHPWEAFFNKPRSAFVLSSHGDTRVRWFGLRSDIINQVFITANEQFDWDS